MEIWKGGKQKRVEKTREMERERERESQGREKVEEGRENKMGSHALSSMWAVILILVFCDQMCDRSRLWLCDPMCDQTRLGPN